MPCQDLTRQRLCPGADGAYAPTGLSQQGHTQTRQSRTFTRPPGDPTTSVGAAATVKEKLNIVDFVGETVQLKKAGTIFKGLCPFHGERTASFVVTPARETWHCFGCGRGGDLFNFVMERDGVDFPTALRSLAGRAGVEISERTTREDAQRKRLRDALEAAIAFYHRVLTSHPAGQPALDYLRGRGFTDVTIETHLLGWAPDSYSALTHALTSRRNMTEPDLEAAGLVSRRQSARGGSRGVFDRFRARIIFPIRDAQGGATGLGGRILGTAEPGRDTGPKYLNSPATLLFDKSRTLYLIDRARSAIRKSGRAVLVEGNTDALMAHQQGFENVIGSLGTALTAGQVELVTRYAPRIALAYDVDTAGQDAATFGATELTALVGEIERSEYRGRLTDVDVVRLPDGRDPDEVMRDDPDLWRAATEQPQPIMEFLIDHYATLYDQRTAGGKDRLVDALVPTLRTVTDSIRLDGYLLSLSRRISIDVGTLKERLRQPERSQASNRRGSSGHVGAKISLHALMAVPGALDPRAVERALEPVESALLRMLLVHPELIAAAKGRLSAEALVTTPARELWKALQAAPLPLDRTPFLDALEPTLAEVARTLHARTDPLPETDEGLHQALDQSLLTLDRSRLSETIEFTRAELAEAEAAEDDATRDRLRQTVLELQRRRLDLDRERQATSLLAKRRHPPIATPTGGLA